MQVVVIIRLMCNIPWWIPDFKKYYQASKARGARICTASVFRVIGFCFSQANRLHLLHKYKIICICVGFWRKNTIWPETAVCGIDTVRSGHGRGRNIMMKWKFRCARLCAYLLGIICAWSGLPLQFWEPFCDYLYLTLHAAFPLSKWSSGWKMSKNQRFFFTITQNTTIWFYVRKDSPMYVCYIQWSMHLN